MFDSSKVEKNATEYEKANELMQPNIQRLISKRLEEIKALESKYKVILLSSKGLSETESW